jgi:hypothetical protein
VDELGEGLVTQVSEALMPQRRGGGSKECRGWKLKGVEGPSVVTPDDLAPSRKILHRAAKRVKFHTTVVVNSELTNRNEILNEIRGNKDVIKVKVVREMSRAGGGDRDQTAIANNNARRGRMQKREGEESIPASYVTWLVAPVSKYQLCWGGGCSCMVWN